MGTLEGALQEVLGYDTVHTSKGEIQLLCIHEPSTLEQATSHALRELMVAHSQQRSGFKLKVTSPARVFTARHSVASSGSVHCCLERHHCTQEACS